MIFIFFALPIGIISGIIYLISQSANKGEKSEGDSWTFSTIMVVVIWNFFGIIAGSLGNSAFLAIALCTFGSVVLLSCLSKSDEDLTNADANKRQKDIIEKQEKYDNDWGIPNKK